MRHDLIEQLFAGEPVPGPSALDLDLAPTAAAHERRESSGPRTLSAFDVADEDAEARLFARRRLVGVAVAGAGSAFALLGALAIGF